MRISVISVFFVVLLYVQFALSQISQEKIDSVSLLLEIKKELYFLSIEPSNSIKLIGGSVSYLTGLLNDEPDIIKPTTRFLFKISDFSFYKFITLGRTEYPWIKIFAINTDNKAFILEDEPSFYNEITNSMSFQDSLKLVYLSEIYEKINSSLYEINIPKNSKELPYYNWLVKEEYFKITSIENGFMYRSFFKETTKYYTDMEVVTLTIIEGKLKIRKELYKREPK